MRTFRNIAVVSTAAAALIAPAAVANAAPTDKPTTGVEQLLLADGEFPAGYEILPFSIAERLQITAPISQFADKLKVTPAECAPKVTPALTKQATDLPMVTAFNERNSNGLAQVLSPKPVGVNPGSLANCSNVKVELAPSEQLPAKALVNIRLSRVSLPGLPAGTTVIATEGTGTVTINGEGGKPGRERAVKVNQIEGVTQVRGYTVVITGTGSQGGTLDRGAFVQTVNKAVQKVQNAR